MVLAVGCGPGFEGYSRLYQEPDASLPGKPWAGKEVVWLQLDEEEREVPLAGLPTTELNGAAAVPLTAVVEAAGIVAKPERYRYNFTATDGYDLLVKRGGPEGLPGWTEMGIGVLYLHPAGDLRVAWDRSLQPWGSALSAYRIKLMDRGRITLLEGH